MTDVDPGAMKCMGESNGVIGEYLKGVQFGGEGEDDFSEKMLRCMARLHVVLSLIGDIPYGLCKHKSSVDTVLTFRYSSPLPSLVHT